MKITTMKNGTRTQYTQLSGKLNIALETACYMLDLDWENLVVFVDYDHKCSPDRSAWGMFKYEITVENRRVVGKHPAVSIYLKGKDENEACYLLAHELGHAEHYHIGILGANDSYEAKETYADMAAYQIGQRAGFEIPSYRAWAIGAR